MSRSSKKGPYIDEKLLRKVTAQKPGGPASAKATAGKQKAAIKTWARASQIPPEFVGSTFLVHNGKEFKEVFVTEAMVGHRLGEFSATRTFRGHGKIVKRVMTKT